MLIAKHCTALDEWLTPTSYIAPFCKLIFFLSEKCDWFSEHDFVWKKKDMIKEDTQGSFYYFHLS